MTSLRPPCGITFTGPVMPLCLSTTLASQPLSCPAASVPRPPCQGPRAGAAAGGGQICRLRGGPRARLGPRRAEARGPRLAGSSGAPHPVPLANFPFRFPAAPARPEARRRATRARSRSLEPAGEGLRKPCVRPALGPGRRGGRTMPADTPGKLRASPRAGAPAGARRTPDQPRSAAEHRKSSKPVMEKRRRARINESLAQLRSLLLDALRKEVSRGWEGEIGEPGIRALPGCQPPTPAPPPELPPLEAGEGGHPGADREAPAEPAARAGDSRPPRRPGSPGQVPRRLPRVSGRGESLPGRLRGRPGRRAVPPARPSGGLPGPAGALAPPASTGPRRRSSGARGLRGPPATAGLRRPLPVAALRGRLGAALPAGPDGGAPRRPRGRGSGPGRTLEAVAAVRSRPQNPLRQCQKIFISRDRVGSFVLPSS
ncbi:transcription factor HES-4 isoform 3-T3 [Megaptera novaeangliae]